MRQKSGCAYGLEKDLNTILKARGQVTGSAQSIEVYDG